MFFIVFYYCNTSEILFTDSECMTQMTDRSYAITSHRLFLV